MANTGFFDRVTDAFSGLGGGFRGFGEEVSAKGRELNVRLIEMAQENTEHGFNAARAVFEAQDMREVFQLQQSAVREGLERSVNQTREIAEMFAQATSAAFKPLTDAVEDVRSGD